MKTLLFLAEKADLEGRAGGAFGAFGWSGEANDRIFQTMKHVFRMDMLGDCLRLKSSRLGGRAADGPRNTAPAARKLKTLKPDRERKGPHPWRDRRPLRSIARGMPTSSP